MSRHYVQPVDQGWEFKQADQDDSSYLPVAQFPTMIHLDLLAHKLIPDPNIGKNELECQWVGEKVWVYRTTFTIPPEAAAGQAGAAEDGAKVMLAFDGLDTFATVVLNGETILETDNMFIPQRVDVTKQLRGGRGDVNELVITFDSAYLRGWERVEKHPDHEWACWNGDSSRLAVRKSQYHWGWDWGPTLLTCGPWRPINLEIYGSRIADLWCDTEVDEYLKTATVTAHATVEGYGTSTTFELALGEDVVDRKEVDAGSSATFTLSDPKLWYPARYGEQILYKVSATLKSDGEGVHTVSKKIGLRRARLVQRAVKDQPGTSFFFEINNIPIFCGGSNWIPADNFIPRIDKQRYHDWVKLVADGNQFMLRVWGGGIWEEQALYDACDELGVLVWQDFMFGCGNYPAWPELLDSIKQEAEENVKLLRHHPSIVIFAGNNEDYQVAESLNLTWDKDNHDAESWLKTNFPARYIYEKILPDVCKDLVPGTHYHPGSPWGGVDTKDPTVGDIHQWNVWHGTQEKYQNFDKLSGRFVSEFGMEAFPSVKTIDAFLPKGKDDPDRYPQSSTIDFHNKADGHERRIALYLVENMRYAPDPLEQFVYSTQLMQAECLASAYRLWKRQWKGPGREYCAGALVWQINDCWPVTSWAIVDYYLRPKHAYFTVKREMAPLSVGMTRKEHRHEDPKNKYSRVNVKVTHEIEIWGSNLQLEDLTVDCVVRAWNVETGEQTYEKIVAEKFDLPKNQSTEIAAFEVPAKHKGDEAKTVVATYLIKDGKQVTRYVNWPEPLKYLHFQKPKELRVELSKDGKDVEISAEVPIKGVAVECEDDDVKFADNLVDIVPGETVRIGVAGASKDTEFGVRYLGML
ncbi:glycoside hydrolase superfamily [Microdochium bolleyi]|uniref:Beta-mannosidase B n=1 Tax=Microdochium bolleyi TaxID=196109 RepID=A0A136JG51_9PEZI|nr:glycoside hydrolase superfamily [Microdochium bolleyi]